MRDQSRRLIVNGETPADDANAIWSLILTAIGSDITPNGAITEFTPTIQRLHAMSLVDGEVNNGGFNQLFFNGGGGWLPRAIEGFESAGMPDHRDVVLAVQRPAAREEAMRSAARVANSLEAFARTYDETSLGEFDARWYKLPPVYDALDRFVVEHASEIWES